MPIRLEGNFIIQVFLFGETDEYFYIGNYGLIFTDPLNSMYLGVI